MGLKQLAKHLSHMNGLSIEENERILIERKNVIGRHGNYLTAFNKDKYRLDEFNEIEKNKVKLGGNGDE